MFLKITNPYFLKCPMTDVSFFFYRHLEAHRQLAVHAVFHLLRNPSEGTRLATHTHARSHNVGD